MYEEITFLQSQPLQKKRILKSAVMMLIFLVLDKSVTLNFLCVTSLTIHFPLVYLPPVAKSSLYLPFLFPLIWHIQLHHNLQMTFCFLVWK